MKNVKHRIYQILYYNFAVFLPNSDAMLLKGSIRVGKLANIIRFWICKKLFRYCGKNVKIQKGAHFGNGGELCIGDNSGLGVNCVVPSSTIIGKDVMMGPNCYIHSVNHCYERTDIPMRLQGVTEPKPCIIDDDVWIGRDVTIMVGRHISKGTIVASNSVVTKDYPPYSIIGGNPAKLIKSRLDNAQDTK